jgi:hypothetical protein
LFNSGEKSTSPMASFRHFFSAYNIPSFRIRSIRSKSPRVHLNAPPITNADDEPHHDPCEDDVDTPTVAGIHRACTEISCQ